MRRICRASGFAAFLSTMAAPSALAAQAAPAIPRPPTPEEIRRPAPEGPNRPSRLTIEGGIERSPCALAKPDFAAIRFTPRSIVFDGLKGLPAEALREAYAPYLDQDQPISILCEIRDRAATILRQAGYIAAVEIPEQKIAAGNIRFRVLMGTIVAIRVRGDAGREEKLIAAYLGHLKDEEAFNRYDAERYLLLARDLPGYDVRLTLRSAGTAPGELIGDVTVVHRPVDIDVNIQDYGSTALGRWGGLVRAQLYGLTGLGDRTSLGFYSTSDFDEQQTIEVGHEMRLGGEGFAIGGDFTYSWAHPDVNDPSLDIRSHTMLATLEASYPFRRTLADSLRGSAGIDIVDQDVTINRLPLSRDRLRVAFARLVVDETDPASFRGRAGYSASEPLWHLAATLELRQGLDIFGATQPCGASLARCLQPGIVPPSHLEGDPTAALFRMQALAEYRPAPKLTLALGVRGQYAGKPLLSFEEFAAGNYTAGRGYDPGALLGDRGFGVQSEIRYGTLVPPNAKAIVVQPYLFFDAAWIRNEDRLLAPGGHDNLTSIGGGARAAFGDRAFLDATLAVPLERAGLQTRRGGVRFLISLTTRFSPGVKQ